MQSGDCVFLTGPLDCYVGVVDLVDGMWVRLKPGAAKSRWISDATRLLATGEPPSGTEYAVCPLGANVMLLSVTGYEPLPRFDPKDWPAQS